ncbi:LysR family transcriptional regulator [Mycolicibacterium sp. Dal123E01]|uniref:LysR family transcriptional regulator n=1 Tax=Mycolicibacterium sp. Dal123E01 TaxID=3457578 RepID=UPI00403EA06D
MSFSRAAERANVAQTALSTSISKLEHELACNCSIEAASTSDPRSRSRVSRAGT